MKKRKLLLYAACAVFPFLLAGCTGKTAESTVSQTVSRVEDSASKVISGVEDGASKAVSGVESFLDPDKSSSALSSEESSRIESSREESMDSHVESSSMISSEPR